MRSTTFATFKSSSKVVSEETALVHIDVYRYGPMERPLTLRVIDEPGTASKGSTTHFQIAKTPHLAWALFLMHDFSTSSCRIITERLLHAVVAIGMMSMSEFYTCSDCKDSICHTLFESTPSCTQDFTGVVGEQ